MNKKIFFGVIGIILLLVGYTAFLKPNMQKLSPTTTSDRREETANPKNLEVPSEVQTVTLTGTYVCLPLLSGAVSTADCAFGIRTDTGDYYAVNFGASAGSMADFQDGSQITAKGTIILSKDLNPNHWIKFNSLGLFTVLEKL